MNKIKKRKDVFGEISVSFAKIRKFIYSSIFDNMVLKRVCAIVFFAVCLMPHAFSSKPVTVMVSLSPPYTPFLHEYASAAAHKLQVSLLVNDSRMVNYPVKLQMFVEHVGSGIVMRTAEYAAIAPVLLTGNVTEVLSGFDLSSYFRAQNLVFSGFDQSQYVQTGRIPDGQYRIGFRVVDAQRPEVVLSNTAYTQAAWFTLNEPPQVNMPRNNEKVRVQDVQNVKLEWFPRHVGSLNGAFATQYQVELYAIRVPGMNPQQIVMSMPADYTYVTSRTSHMLTNAEYMLEPGVEYAVRIKAMAGNDELTLFHNNGYSAVTSFIYGSLCPEPADVSAQTIGTDKVEISWTTDPLHTSFTTRFRKAGNATDTWHSRRSYGGMVEITNVLSPGEEYEYQVQAQCVGSESDYTRLDYVTLPTPPPADFTCGERDSGRVRNTSPKQYLKAGDMIYYGQFPIKLTEVSGGNGMFNGKGRMRIPFLANVQIHMQFAGIKVNEYNEVYEGELVSVYDPDSQLLVDDITDYLAEGDQIGNIIDGVDSAAVTLDFVIDDVSAADVRISGNTLTIQSGGKQATVTIEHGEEGTTIKDAEGNLYAVDQAETLSRIGKSGGNAAQQIGFSTDSLDDEREIRFSNAGTWAFDSLSEVYAQSKFAEEFEQIDGTIIPWKFVPIGKADKVQVHLTKGTIDLDKVTFTTPTGTEFFAERSGDDIVLTLIGAKERDGYELYAVYQEDDSTTTTIGKLNIASYPLVDRFVTIVPMHDKAIDTEQLTTAVNTIYKPYGIRWHIEVDSVFTDRSWDTEAEGLQATGSEFYSEFTAEMRALNQQYVFQRGIDEESVYIFWFAERSATENLLGDMPLKSRFGYLFTPSIEDAQRTIAHELAHGAFQLRHTFSERYGIEKHSTPNLMDYARVSELTKYQWDIIHDPHKMLFPWMQGEEEGRMEKIAYRCLPSAITKTNSVEHYYTNTPGKTIKLTEDYVPIAFIGMADTYGDQKGGVAIIQRLSDGALYYPAKNYQEYPDYYRKTENGIDVSDNIYTYLESGDEEKALLVEIQDDCSYTIIRNGTIIREEDYTYNCDCKNNTDANNSVVKTVAPNLTSQDYAELVDKLAERLNTQSSQNQYIIKDNHFAPGQEGEFFIEDYTDRFKVFNTETGDNIYVDIVYSYNKPTSEQLSTLAEDVYEKSNIAGNSNSIYIVLPFWNETTITESLKQIDGNKFSISYFSKNETYQEIPESVEYTNISGNVFEVIESIYRIVPKPHKVISYAITYNGEIVEFKIQEFPNKRENDYIYDFRLAVDKLFYSFTDQVNIIESNQPRISPSGYGSQNSQQTTERHNQAILRAQEAREQIEKYRTEDNKIEYTPIEHGLFESALIPNSEGKSIIAKQFTEWYVRHEFGWSADSPDDEYFKTGKNKVVYEETLNSIDALSLMLAPVGLDVVGDIIGTIYAGCYSDIETASFYLGGVVLTGVPASVFRQILTREKKIVRKFGEFRIVDNVPKSIRTIETIHPDIARKLKQLPDGGERFLQDFAEVSEETFQKFVDNPELIDAWKKMDNLGADDALRQNVGALEALSKPKGSRPDPSEYLSRKYIDEHLAKFDNGVGRISTRANFKKYGTLGGDESFVLPESELRKILIETGGNVREIEKRLGFDPGDLGDNPVFGVFKREDLGELKMPSGNESGASKNWILGGKTSGGTSEAIVDLSKNTSFELIGN